VKTGDMLPDYDFSKGVRGKHAKSYRERIKAHRERPNLWHVIVTLFAMFYLGRFSGTFFSLAHSSGANAVILIYTLILFGAWAYLILDLMRQGFLIAKWVLNRSAQQK